MKSARKGTKAARRTQAAGKTMAMGKAKAKTKAPAGARAKARVSGSGTVVRGVMPCLTFKDQTEEAVNFYVSVFANSRIVSLVRSDDPDGPIPEGKVHFATFELAGQRYSAFDGGESFSFTTGVSLMAVCPTQKELDRVWDRLLEGGGKEVACGWLTDRFGLSWQVVPESLTKMLAKPEGGNLKKLMEVLLDMVKLDAAALEKAYKQKT
jgi:predicted 3-demethylubiquinone-9 3-methyltransferase (glyoxalase superfamily)